MIKPIILININIHTHAYIYIYMCVCVCECVCVCVLEFLRLSKSWGLMMLHHFVTWYLCHLFGFLIIPIVGYFFIFRWVIIRMALANFAPFFFRCLFVCLSAVLFLFLLLLSNGDDSKWDFRYLVFGFRYWNTTPARSMELNLNRWEWHR